MTTPVQYGFCVPLFANPGMLFFRTPNYEKLDWDSIKETALLSERLGFDSLFIADHLFLGREGEIWECLSLMAALLAVTEKTRVIPIHLCNNFRHPGLVAKALATMSHIGRGRVALFYDYGWRKAEFEQYGIPFGHSDDERIAKMAEGLEVIRGLLGEDDYSFDGEFYSLTGAVCRPKPVEPIPVWMGEANHPLMVEQIVRHADVFNSMPCSLEVFQAKVETVRAECRRQDRDPSHLGLSLETQVLIRETEEEVEAELEKYRAKISRNNSLDTDILDQLRATGGPDVDWNATGALKQQFMIGTPSRIRSQIEAFIDEGVSHFMIWFMDYPEKHGMELFAREFLDKGFSDRPA